LAKADTAFQAHPLVNRLNLALGAGKVTIDDPDSLLQQLGGL
jgi:hypothetical protein